MPIKKATLAERYKQVTDTLDFNQFEIPRGQQNSKVDFPTYLKEQLARYVAYYTDVLMPLIEDEDGMPFGEGEEMSIPVLQKSLLDNITVLSAGINQVIGHYYDGRLLQATEAFRQALNDISFTWLTSVSNIPARCNFYRTRVSDSRLTRKELFHNPFENRGRVATSRYSIPGLPALYLGDSIYVCWEEARRRKMDDLYFSRFHNTQPVRVVKIQRVADFLRELETPHTGATSKTRLAFLVRYLAVFPLCLACSIKTKSDEDTFKPEYIIPQLLLQYVTAEKSVVGIKFPSTRVDYSKIHGVPAYNYVFPVKRSQTDGHCPELVNNFLLTEPTSIQLESLLNYSGLPVLAPHRISASGFISLVDGVDTPYSDTAFGRMEEILYGRTAMSLFDF